MAYRIDPELCNACGACEPECPHQAISMRGDHFVINPARCTGCQGEFDVPQCVLVCPNGGPRPSVRPNTGA
ncbi:MAG: 4Fe-4S binding protein [Azospirillaceae bacterium]|nr:4Fe-4S binding protein [Azospirillaceae bacterium]